MLYLVVSTRADAVLEELWSVEQGTYEIGWCWPDLNGDGIQELIKEDGSTSWFYDGAAEYELLWSVSDPEPADSSWFGLWWQDDGYLVFLHQEIGQQLSRLHVYEALAGAEAWNSGLLQGNVSRGGTGDVDGDGQLELAWSWHRATEGFWASAWEVRGLRDGASVHAESLQDGYLTGPFPGNVEDDSSEELLLNWLYEDGSSVLSCWGFSGTGVAEPRNPGGMGNSLELEAWPNPFNPLCRISVEAPPASVLKLRIVDLRGALVRRFSRVSHPGGGLQLVWDGLDSRGRPQPSGIYFVQVGDQSLPITLLR